MEETLKFLSAMIGSRPIEITAVVLGVLNVGLIIRRSIWNYPFGIVMVSLYAWIFFQAKLYSDSLLQIYFFCMQLYGWWFWARGKADAGEVVVRRLPVSQYSVYIIIAIVGIAGWGTAMARFTDASLPYPDATIAVLSMIAQFLMAKRYLENWVLWVVVDVVAIAVFLYKDLEPTALLYLIFLIMATTGLFVWHSNWRKQQHA